MTTDEIRQILDAIDRGDKIEYHDIYSRKWVAVDDPLIMFQQLRIADERYPYTYAADYLRENANIKISRNDASCVRSVIAAVIGMPDEELAMKLADKYLEEAEK